MRTVMYIDDDDDDRDFVKQILLRKSPQPEIILAATGTEGFAALMKLAENGAPLPAVIILDLNMPGWDGKQTFTRIRAENHLREIPIAVLTSSHSASDKQFFAEKTTVRFFTKPASLTQLSDILDEILK